MAVCVSVFTVSPLSFYESDWQTQLCLFGFLQRVHPFLSSSVDDVNFVNCVFSHRTVTMEIGTQGKAPT